MFKSALSLSLTVYNGYIYIFVGVLTQTVNQRQSRGRETVGTVGSRICDYAGECYHYTTALHAGIQC